MIHKSCPAYPVNIFMAGHYAKALEVCRQYCDDIGFCVTVTPTHYVYTGGHESGIIVGLINYPRFPAEPTEIVDHAIALAERLRVNLGQESYTIQTPDAAYWTSYRKEPTP